MNNKKTAEEILITHSPFPNAGYKDSWIITPMQEFASQELEALKEENKQLEELVKEALPFVKWYTPLRVEDVSRIQSILDKARKLLK